MESGKKIRVFNLGGVFWVRSVLDPGKKIRVFRGWVFWVRSDSDSEKNFIFGGGVFWVRSDLDSGKNFIGRVFWNQIPEQWCSGEFGQKFLET